MIFHEVISESLTLSESLSRGAMAISVTVTDTISLEEVPGRLRPVSAEDSFTLDEVLSRPHALEVEEALSLSEALSGSASLYPSDSISLTELLQSSGSVFGRVISESLSFAETLSGYKVSYVEEGTYLGADPFGVAY